VKLKGRNGFTREYRAVLSSASAYSFLPKVDAFRLGYTETAYTEIVTRPPNLVSVATGNGLLEGVLIRIAEASVGRITVSQVDFLAFDINQHAACDVVLGKSFLQTLRFSIDYLKKEFRLEKSQ
jgi:predicted aspartyl protease